MTKNTSSVVTRRERLTYEYDASGIRIGALHEIDADANNTYETRTRTEFLVDHRNHTGYQQVLRETHYDAVTEDIIKTVDYAYGHDELLQTTQEYDSEGEPDGDPVKLAFGHDGHGSVRVLTDLGAAVLQLFVYDAYGQLLAIANAAGTLTSGGNGMLASAGAALTTVLYSGEQFDPRLGQQYLRARWYDPATGRFNRLDPFFGNLSDPQSFHKYLYTHADPVNGIDPTGRSLISAMAGIAVRLAFSSLVAGAVIGVLSGIDATFDNRPFSEGFAEEWSFGWKFGLAAPFLPQSLLVGSIVLFSALGTADSIDRENYPQAAFRLVTAGRLRHTGQSARLGPWRVAGGAEEPPRGRSAALHGGRRWSAARPLRSRSILRTSPTRADARSSIHCSTWL